VAGISLKATYIFGCLTLLLTVIPIKQLMGYSYWETSGVYWWPSSPSSF